MTLNRTRNHVYNLSSVNLQKQLLEVFYKKAVFKHFAIVIGKHLCYIIFLIKLQHFRPSTLLKRDYKTGVFLWIFRKFQKHVFWRTSANSCFRICNMIVVITLEWCIHRLPNLLRWVMTLIYFGAFSHLNRRCRCIDIGSEYVNYRTAWQLFTNILYKRLIFENLKNKEAFSFLHSYIQDLEAVARMCSVIKVFLKISQNSQENTYARVSFSIIK